MMKFLSLLLLLSFSLTVSAVESSIFNWDWTGSVNNRTVPVKTVEIPTLGAPLMVSSTVGTQICFLRNVQPPKNTLLWKNSCFFYHNSTSDSAVLSKMSRRARRLLIKESSFNPLPGKYFVAIATAEDTIGFTVALTSIACAHPYFGPGCYQNSTDIVPENETVTAEPGNYFLVDLPEETTRFDFKVQRVRSADRVVISLRAGNAPLGNQTSDFSLTLTDDEPHSFQIDNPLPTIWYGTVSLPASSALRSLMSEEPVPQVSFSYLYHTCFNGSGVCPTVNTLNNTQAQALIFNAAVGQLTFFKAHLDGPAFNFSVQNKDDSSAAPTLYARLNQLPSHANGSTTTKDAYDVSSSNNVVNFITLDEYEAGTWYFAVVGNGKPFAVWFNNTCPSSCSSNGHCVQKEGVYVCQCNDGYEGFDCTVQTESGFKTEYIVLIVIGSIIALAALLGLLVYLYNRNRHPGGGYEKI